MATQQLEVEILTVGSPSFTKTARGGYNSIEVAYKNHSFDGKVEGKKLVDFNDKQVFDFFKGLKSGDQVMVTKEKGEDDKYWKWVQASYNGGGTTPTANSGATEAGSDVSTPQGHAPQTSGRSGGRVTGSNYETPEERAKRQVYIVRQSSIANAIAFLDGTNPGNYTQQEVIDLAKVFEGFIFEKGEVPF